ncbi:MAG: hypothetical protein Q8O20_05520 [Sulfuricurvum sp.]|uniref:hypothetical protein n=1 Tax=Sulfuricurvum sp. TaxID=2025608 RepID=UPI002733D9A6|nr:hypothetical protein [Sulfuricurvum sp.]MDP2850515.1 hypothetical protein [Sulfuricurvum sp.]
MRNKRWIRLIILSSIFSNIALSQDNIQCGSNDTQCVNNHLNSAKSIEIKKIESEGTSIIEETSITITKTSSLDYGEADLQSMPGFNKPSLVHTVADISINKLQSFKKQPENSFFKTILPECPALRKHASIQMLIGKEAQCEFQSSPQQDLCSFMNNCPIKDDQRIQLISNGVSKDFKCSGTLIETLKSICFFSSFDNIL